MQIKNLNTNTQRINNPGKMETSLKRSVAQLIIVTDGQLENRYLETEIERILVQLWQK